MKLSYFTLFLSFSVIMYFITQLGSFHTYWNKRLREHKKAKRFLTQESCVDPYIKADLGDFNLCTQSEEILSQSPFFKALYDLAEDNSLCGRGKCYMFYTDVTSNIHKIIITLGILSILVCFLSGLQIKRHRHENAVNYYRLPIKND